MISPARSTPGRIISEKRAAAARANGAKSRGPVTARGKANSSRSSRRHGLRSRTLFADRESADHLTAILASLERAFQPQSGIEPRLIGTMALAQWRQTCLWKLETAVLNREVRRLKSLTPDESPATLLARAFRSLSDHTCFLHIFYRLEARFERQYDAAFSTLTEHRAWRREYAANRIPEKVNVDERTRQVTENTQPHSGATQENASSEPHPRRSQSIDNPNPKKVIADERTQQAAENTSPRFTATARS